MLPTSQFECDEVRALMADNRVDLLPYFYEPDAARRVGRAIAGVVDDAPINFSTLDNRKSAGSGFSLALV
jgi:hypothetical protein